MSKKKTLGIILVVLIVIVSLWVYVSVDWIGLEVRSQYENPYMDKYGNYCDINDTITRGGQMICG